MQVVFIPLVLANFLFIFELIYRRFLLDMRILQEH